MGNFSISQSVFYSFKELSPIFIKFEIAICKLRAVSLEESEICYLGSTTWPVSLPDNKMADFFNLKAIADDKMCFIHGKLFLKGEKPTLPLFPQCFQVHDTYFLMVVETQYCLVKG